MYQELVDKKAKLGVIGLGYVGLPIALEFARKISVIGFDINNRRVELMRKGIDPSKEVVVQCKMGGRSARAIEALRSAGYTGPLKNLRGGITAWSNEVDPKVPKY